MTGNVQSNAALAAVARLPAAIKLPTAPPTARRRGSSEHDGTLERADVPAALDHASADVDEFDAALVRGAGGVPLDATADEPRTLSEREIDQEAEVEGDVTEDELQEIPGYVPRRLRRLPARPSAAATARSVSYARAGLSYNVCSGPTAVRSRRRPPSCSGSSQSQASTLAPPTMSPRKSSNSSSKGH